MAGLDERKVGRNGVEIRLCELEGGWKGREEGEISWVER